MLKRILFNNDFSSEQMYNIGKKIFIFFLLISVFLVIASFFISTNYNVQNLSTLNDSSITPNINKETKNFILYDNSEFNEFAICSIQNVATLIAFIISISLIAFQLTASSYSPQIIEILKVNHPQLWMMKFLYVFLFFFTWILTLFVPNIISIIIISALNLIGIIALIPYSAYVMEILNPTYLTGNVVDSLNLKETKEKTINFEEKFENLIDIILSSIKSYDISATKAGILGYEKKLTYLIKEDFKFVQTENYAFDKYYYTKHILTLFNSCNSICFLAGGLSIMDLLETIGKLTIERRRDDETYLIILGFAIMGMSLQSPNIAMSFRPVEGICNIVLSSENRNETVSITGLTISKIAQNLLVGLLNNQISDSKGYHISNITYGLIHSLIINFDLIKNKNDDFFIFIVKMILENNSKDSIKSVLSEIELLWSKPKNINEVANFLLSHPYCKDVLV